MAFSRSPALSIPPSAAELTANMVGIGMSFAAKPSRDAAIETTLVHASSAGMVDDDLRVLAVLTTWMGVHHAHVNADRLIRLVSEHTSERVRAYWSAIAHWLKKDRRFARLRDAYKGPVIDLLATGTAFQIKRRGEDHRFEGSSLQVPEGTLRDRSQDVLTPQALLQQHHGYRNRVLMGPSFRADVWTVLERMPSLAISDVARQAACSFATAWQATQDFRLLRSAKPFQKQRPER